MKNKCLTALALLLVILLAVPFLAVSLLVRLKLRTIRLNPRTHNGPLRRWIADFYFRDQCSWKWVARIAMSVRQENLARGEAESKHFRACVGAGKVVTDPGWGDMWEFTMTPMPGQKGEPIIWRVPMKPIIRPDYP